MSLAVVRDALDKGLRQFCIHVLSDPQGAAHLKNCTHDRSAAQDVSSVVQLVVAHVAHVAEEYVKPWLVVPPPPVGGRAQIVPVPPTTGWQVVPAKAVQSEGPEHPGKQVWALAAFVTQWLVWPAEFVPQFASVVHGVEHHLPLQVPAVQSASMVHGSPIFPDVAEPHAVAQVVVKQSRTF